MTITTWIVATFEWSEEEARYCNHPSTKNLRRRRRRDLYSNNNNNNNRCTIHNSKHKKNNHRSPTMIATQWHFCQRLAWNKSQRHSCTRANGTKSSYGAFDTGEDRNDCKFDPRHHQQRHNRFQTATLINSNNKNNNTKTTTTEASRSTSIPLEPGNHP